MKFSTLIKKPELQVLGFFIGGCCLISTAYVGRLAVSGWDVVLNKNDPFPFQKYKHHDDPKLFVASLRDRKPEVFASLNDRMSNVE
eukprot:ANDGO_02151.mRNA.1 hypothetical protein